MSPTSPKDQLALDEKVVEDAELVAKLERREQLRTEMAALRIEFVEVDRSVRAEVDKLDLGVDTAIRIGRFRISRTLAPARSVTFETEAKERITIGAIDDGGEE